MKRLWVLLTFWISCFSAGSVSAHLYNARWYGFNGPWGMVATPSGDVLVIEHLSNRVKMIRSDSLIVDLWGTTGSGPGQLNDPHGMTLDSEGHVFIADTGNNRIQKFSMDGTFLLSVGTSGSSPGQFNSPEDVAIGPEASLFVTDRRNHRVQVFSPEGDFKLAWGDSGSGPGRFSEIQGIAVGGDGTVYVVDNATNLVEGFDASGRYLFSWGLNDGTLAPWDVMIGPDGGIYVGGWGYVRKYSPEGALVNYWCLSFDGGFYCLADHIDEIWGARGIAVDANHRIYVTDPNYHSVVRFLDNSKVPVVPTTWGTLKNRFAKSGP